MKKMDERKVTFTLSFVSFFPFFDTLANVCAVKCDLN